MPAGARSDLVEWGPAPSAEAMARAILDRRIPLATIVPDQAVGPVITDDRPLNEYYLVRRFFRPARG